MLYWFYQAKSLELRIGKTTSTSLVFAIYPMLFLLLLAITLLHLPYCIDWIFGHATIAVNDKANILNIAIKNISTVYLEDCLLLLFLTILMAMFHSNPLDLQTRLRSYHSNRFVLFFIIIFFLRFLIIFNHTKQNTRNFQHFIVDNGIHQYDHWRSNMGINTYGDYDGHHIDYNWPFS